MSSRSAVPFLSFVIALFLSVAVGPCQALSYRITYLPGEARGINDSGQIVGPAFIRDGTGDVRTLASLGGTSVMAYAVNNSGMTVGSSTTAPGSYTKHACVWDSAGNVTDIKAPRATSSVAYDVNTAGTVVGEQSIPGEYSISAFVWNKTTGVKNLEAPTGYRFPYAYGINSSGVVVGEASVVAPTGGHRSALLWDTAGVAHDLHDSGWINSRAWKINDFGQVIGTGEMPQDYPVGWLWDPVNGRTELGSLGGRTCNVSGINNHGQVVGFAFDPGQKWHACIWDGTSSARAIDLPEWSWSIAFDINDAGQIVGYAQCADGVYRGVLWEPVPEPSGMMALMAGIGALGGMVIRRRGK